MSISRSRPGCLNCRLRHYKCDDEQAECSRCQAKGLECIRAYNIRFKHGSNPSVANVKGSGLRKCDYDFAKDQVWCRTTGQLQFIDETQGIVTNYEESSVLGDPAATHLDDTASPYASTSQRTPSYTFDSAVTVLEDHDFDHDNHRYRPKRRRLDSHVTNSDVSFASPVRSGFVVASPSASSVIDTLNTLDYLPRPPTSHSTKISDGLDPLTQTVSHDIVTTVPSPLNSILTRLYLDGSPWPLQQKQEAILMRHFVENLSISMDICDPDRHFALVVPHRASICPTLLNAIFACSARHLSRVSDFDSSISERYHQECLKHLIPSLSDGAALMDENLLAATVILRFFEEVKVTGDESDDNESHLLGSHIFITAQESSTITGGLRQAAFWVGLRQEIFFAYLKQRSILPTLTHCNIDRSFEAANDHIWANRIIVHCADVIRYCYGDGSQNTSAYAELTQYCDDWMLLKPSSFAPMYYKDADEWNLFPEIWLLGDAVVTGMQHYYLARILLTAHNPHLPRLGPASKVALRGMEEEIKSCVRLICAMALSNPRAPPNFASAMLAITCVGDKFTDRAEQLAMLNILEKAGEVHASLSVRTQNQLKEAWAG